jgi:hypothetical protein
MTLTPLGRPEPRRLLPATAVEALIAEADQQMTALEREAAAAVAAADAAETQLALAGADERSSAWAMIQLERFVTGLHAEVDAEGAAIVRDAELWARRQLEDARAEAERHTRDVAVRWVRETPEPLVADPAPVMPDLVVAPAVAQPEPDAEPAPIPDPLDPADASTDGDALFRAIAPEHLALHDPMKLASDDEFWPVESTRRHRRMSRRSSRVVVAQGAAALLVLAAVLVRVS